MRAVRERCSGGVGAKCKAKWGSGRGDCMRREGGVRAGNACSSVRAACSSVKMALRRCCGGVMAVCGQRGGSVQPERARGGMRAAGCGVRAALRRNAACTSSVVF